MNTGTADDILQLSESERPEANMNYDETYKRIMNCVASDKKSRCDNCTYCGSKRCRDRLLFEALHAMHLLIHGDNQ